MLYIITIDNRQLKISLNKAVTVKKTVCGLKETWTTRKYLVKDIITGSNEKKQVIPRVLGHMLSFWRCCLTKKRELFTQICRVI